MGSRVLEFPINLDSGVTVLVEVDDPQTGNRPVSRSVAEKARQTFEAALAEVMPVVNVLTSRLQELVERPNSVGLEFGIKFTAGADAMIAKTSMEGNVKVTLTWTSA
jgi:hypothetical protein